MVKEMEVCKSRFDNVGGDGRAVEIEMEEQEREVRGRAVEREGVLCGGFDFSGF